MGSTTEAESAGVEALVRELLDREEIRDLASRYVDCVWRRDVEGVVDLFADDATLETDEFPPVTGRADLLDAYKMVFARDRLEPWVQNHIVDVDGDTATGRCFLDLRMVHDGKRLFGAGYYDDEYVRVDGRWRFGRRKVTMTTFWPAARRDKAESDGEGGVS
ncbi:MAG: nuclear transport factor 2 family protein [Acidimicrobiia bacterium]|nr:nuclear transport factor 2 family protein [Acidimicrobiia bacterium]